MVTRCLRCVRKTTPAAVPVSMVRSSRMMDVVAWFVIMAVVVVVYGLTMVAFSSGPNLTMVMVACHMVVSITHMVVSMVMDPVMVVACFMVLVMVSRMSFSFMVTVSIGLRMVAVLMVMVPVMVVACFMVMVSRMSISFMVVVSGKVTSLVGVANPADVALGPR